VTGVVSRGIALVTVDGCMLEACVAELVMEGEATGAIGIDDRGAGGVVMRKKL
jgi:hypothetical protein